MAKDLFGKGTPATPSSGGALTGAGKGGFDKLLAAKQAQSVAAAPPKTSMMDQLAGMKRASDDLAAHRRKPLLVYLLLDATASRRETRAAMRAREEAIASKVTASGGKHPVICMGVSYKGDRCSAPVPLKTQTDVMNFFATPPEAGVTCMAEALTHYLNDPTEAILSLGVFFGDSMDSSDKFAQLSALATQLGDKKRPLVVAHEYTGTDDSKNFCDSIAPAVAKASGAFAFGLSQNPTELESLLDGYKRILSEMPDELKKSAARQSVDMSGLSSPVRDFLARQAGALLEQLSGPK